MLQKIATLCNSSDFDATKLYLGGGKRHTDEKEAAGDSAEGVVSGDQAQDHRWLVQWAVAR